MNPSRGDVKNMYVAVPGTIAGYAKWFWLFDSTSEWLNLLIII
jgi:preprotein translocase subunit SecE